MLKHHKDTRPSFAKIAFDVALFFVVALALGFILAGAAELAFGTGGSRC